MKKKTSLALQRILSSAILAAAKLLIAMAMRATTIMMPPLTPLFSGLL